VGLKRTLDPGIAYTLPALVIVTCLLPFAGIIPGVPPWAVVVGVIAVAIAVCAALIRDRGARSAILISSIGVALGATTFTLLILGISALKGAPDGEAIANASATVAPLVSAALLIVACAWSLLTVRGARGWLVVSWVAAAASPFILAVPVSSLSSAVGNAGMDVIGFFFAPLAALFTWLFILAVAARVPDRGRVRGAQQGFPEDAASR
jgi:hypothetical protein